MLTKLLHEYSFDFLKCQEAWWVIRIKKKWTHLCNYELDFKVEHYLPPRTFSYPFQVTNKPSPYPSHILVFWNPTPKISPKLYTNKIIHYVLFKSYFFCSYFMCEFFLHCAQVEIVDSFLSLDHIPSCEYIINYSFKYE